MARRTKMVMLQRKGFALMNLSNRPVWLLPVITAVIAGVAGAVIIAQGLGSRDSATHQAAAVRSSGNAQIGGPFTLTNHLGEQVTDESFRGRPMLIYFGFTYCPDVCPASLQVMGAALDQLPADDAAKFQPLLISVDPERDTPEALADYVSAEVFPDNLMGLTGTEEQIRDAAAAYRVFYQRVEDDATMAEYLIDHLSVIFLMDANGEFAEIFPHGTAPATVASRLQQFLEENPVQS
jgi:cytochrome oxidase Cu insertion factor (SCO1/SenC/PrrC family)